MTRQSLRISTMLGVSALCMTLAAAPIASGLLSNNASAAGGIGCHYGDNYEAVQDAWGEASDRFTTATMKDLINSIKTLPDYERYAKFFDTYLTIDWDAGEAGKEALNTLKDEINELGINPQDLSNNWSQFDNTLYDIKSSQEYKDNADLRAAVAKARSVNQADIDKAIAAALELKPGADVSDVVSFWDLREALEVNYPELDWPTKGYSEFANYQGLYSAIREVEKNDYSTPYWYFDMFCVAKQANSTFEVQHKLATDPLIGLINPWASSEESKDDGGSDSSSSSNTPSTSNKPSNGTIENKDNGVKVSGINISINYTLNVNLVPSTDLKLTGSNFKNSLNQAFYDIFIRDSQNNVISDTGKVKVSIKLPGSMSAKSDFVVYYVPTAANGDYLTDRAQAIRGVKVSADGWLTFETDHFSVYGIVEYPKNEAPNTGVVAQTDGSSVATTGIKIAAAITSVLTAIGAAIVTHRQAMRKNADKE